MSSDEKWGFSTRSIHVGYESDPSTGAVTPPISLSSTFKQDGIGGFRGGFEYSRGGNPNRNMYEEIVASLEQGKHGLAFASGLAAEDAIIRVLLKPGGSVLMANDVYGGSHRLVSRIHSEWGVSVSTTDFSDLSKIEAAIAERKPDIVWLETPSNPLLKVTDLAEVSKLAHAGGALLVADNTFATPYLQQPLTLGADVVVHSATKYLSGHSDSLTGVVVLNDDDIANKLRFQQFAAGAIASPFDSWLTVRGIRTLGIRVEKHSENALKIAKTLSSDSRVKEVFYPGLESHPGHELAKRQMPLGFGGMLSLRLENENVARKVAESTVLFQLAESLGGVESLMCYPSEMTHASVKGTELAVDPAIIRLSVGIENAEDLLADIDSALTKAS
ncbi:MAG: cystathionine gamma-synthase [Microbacteriaceae bacterium]|nr:cystathionine gamma-synthase [Microbacteriaceae bacterium]